MVIGIMFYPKQLKAEMGKGYSGCMMMGGGGPQKLDNVISSKSA